jgi:phosphohistidine phosphatase
VRRAAAGVVRLVPSLDLLATSPWTRAVQTAEIVNKEYGCDIEELDQLTSEQRPEDLIPWLREHADKEAVGIVGHEPHLSRLVGYLLSGRSSSLVDLKKGGACLVQLDDVSRTGTGRLQWLMTDRELRRIGE